jgi:SpoVK/Ycf46/Vps4 family AAA+-type ATPase
MSGGDPDSMQLQDFIAWISAALEPEIDPALILSLKDRILAQRQLEPGAFLQTRLGLGESESHVVWLLSAIALDIDVRRRMVAITGNPNGDPTLEVIRRVVYGASPTLRAMQELGDGGTLRSLGVIERSDSGGDELHESRQTWAISRRVLAMLLGDASFDPQLAGFVSIPHQIYAVSDLAIGGDAVDAVRAALTHGRAGVCAIGMPGLGRRTLLVSAASEAGIEILGVDARALAKDPAALKHQLRAIARECKILGRVPLLSSVDALESAALDAVGAALVDRLDGRIFVTSSSDRLSLPWKCPIVVVELRQPSTAVRAQLWGSALGNVAPHDAQSLASRYPLAPALIARAVEGALARRGPGETVSEDDLRAGIQAVLDDKLSMYAKRVRVAQSWSDLVLPADQRDTIAELVARIRQRATVFERWGFAEKVGNKGLGVSAMFSGPPGTGKSMCAGLIAKELGLELYVVDMSKIVSKWIGETEKSLAALFDAAEAGHAVLLFDEADALFGKRTEQKSSNDRFANQETNFLLQRLESFTGICFLTTNHDTNIDPAFARRLSLRLRFELPDVEERADLWQAMLPDAAPVDDGIDFQALARRYEMSGGYIRNAALRAAFLAADQGQRITTHHLERAARAEYEAMGKIVADRVARSSL